MCDAHLDAISCLQSAISKDFHTNALRSLAQLYIHHGFLSEEEADTSHCLVREMSLKLLCQIKCLGTHNLT